MPAELEYFDQEVNVSPPSGHFEPVPLTLGPNWQQNDIRMLLVAGAAASQSAIEDVAMTPDPPTGFTSPYSPAPGFGTGGVHYRRLVNGDADTSLA
ncbi:MAG TPA: hypothetical protein VNH17_15925, partial [Streptosporangiaceae bacterium]|nr:hypothetical protein [Streptosporangiaceae bacterium]